MTVDRNTIFQDIGSVVIDVWISHLSVTQAIETDEILFCVSKIGRVSEAVFTTKYSNVSSSDGIM